VLTGKYKPGEAVPAGSRATDESGGASNVKNWLRDSVLEAVQRLVPIAGDAGLSMAQLAIAWVLANPNVSSAIIGASRPEQVVDNVGAAGVKLDADVMKAIDAALGEVVINDPSHTERQSPKSRPVSR
jgi:aryl-alcohol dehydrogenase-like predicted oxidoreductase